MDPAGLILLLLEYELVPVRGEDLLLACFTGELLGDGMERV